MKYLTDVVITFDHAQRCGSHCPGELCGAQPYLVASPWIGAFAQVPRCMQVYMFTLMQTVQSTWFTASTRFLLSGSVRFFDHLCNKRFSVK